MSSTCDKTTQGIWNPTIHQGQTFDDPIQIAVNGAIGYAANDTFEGWITSEEEAEAVLVDYAIQLTDPVNGLIKPVLTPEQTQALPKGALYHDIEWTRTDLDVVIPLIGGRPLIKANSKKRP